jgi:hypothetical protein
VALLVAIPVGFLGASAFNPDRGMLLHSEVLWRIFGIVCEGGVLLVIGLVVVAGPFMAVRKAIARSAHA